MPILRTNKLVKFLALFCGSGALLLILFPLVTTAAFTKQINYQGKLTNASGAAVAGNYDMEFKLYASSTGGTALWTETRMGANQVPVTSGLFSIMLGSVSSLDAIDFNQPLYLSIKINTDAEMTPRKVLGAVSNAFNSEKFDGMATTSFLRSDIANATGTINTFHSQAITVSGNLNAGSITLGGVTRTTWPGGGSDTDVNWSYNPLTDMLTPATSTSGIFVNGTSTMATTSLAFGSVFGSLGGANLSVSEYTLNDLGSFPTINFNSSNSLFSQDLGGLSGGLAIFEKGDTAPALFFIDKTLDIAQIISGDARAASIIFSTTSRALTFNTALSYQFDQNIELPFGKCLSIDGVCATPWSDDGSIIRPINFSRNLILGGPTNIVSSSTTGIFILGGSNNFASSTSPFGGIIGGFRNHLEDGGLIITTGGDNFSDTSGQIFGSGLSTSTSGGMIFGGYGNQAAGSIVIGGSGNVSVSPNGGVLFGESNNTSGWRSVVVGGLNNTVDGFASGVYNGSGNIVSGTASSVLGGDNNNIATTSWGSVILGGRDSFVQGFYSSILAGDHNSIIGQNSVTLDGSYNTITGDYSDIIGGVRNWVSGSGSYAFGYNMTVSGNNSMGFGLRNIDGASTSSNDVISQNNVMAIMGGNVGIGVTNPSTPLSVLGIASSTGLQVNGNGFLTGVLSVGTSSVSSKINIQASGVSTLGLYGTYTDLSSVSYGQRSTYNFNPSVSSGVNQYGSYLETIATSSSGVNLTGDVVGSASYARHFGAGTASSLYGLVSGITNATGAGAVTNAYGLYLASTTGAVTNNYGIYQLGAGATNYFAGHINVGVGSYYKYNGVNLAYGSTTLRNYYFGEAGETMNSGIENTAVGYKALSTNNPSSYNTALGAYSLYNLGLWGDNEGYNTAQGAYSMYNTIDGSNNAVLGTESLYSNISGSNNVAIGFRVGSPGGGLAFSDYDSQLDTGMVLIGALASRDNNTSSTTNFLTNSIAIGYNAKVGGSKMMALGGMGADAVLVGIGTSTPNAYLNVFGSSTANDLFRIATSTNQNIILVDKNGLLNVAGNINIGANSAYKLNSVNLAYGSTTKSNYFFGGAGNMSMTGSGNIGMGILTLRNNTTGSDNVAIGNQSFSSNTSGHSNVANGLASLLFNTTGSANIALGHYALSYNTTGSNNIALGYYAGSASSPNNQSVVDNYMTFLGYYASRDSNISSDVALAKSIAIGYNAKVGGSNMMALGGMGTDAVLVGVGTSTPDAFLSIFGSSSVNNLLHISTSTNQSILTVSNGGNLGVGTLVPDRKLSVVGDGFFQLTATSSLSVSNYNSGGAAGLDFPLLTGHAYTENAVGIDLNVLGVADRLGIIEQDGLANLTFAFYKNNLEVAAQIEVSTTTNTAVFGGADLWSFNHADGSSTLAINIANNTVYVDKLTTNGAVYSNNGILTSVNPSSQNYKSNILDTSLNIDALLGLNVKSFRWKNSGQDDFGLIAEEVKNALPELYLDDGITKGYRSDHLPFYLLQIAQRQAKQISELDSRLANGSLALATSTTEELNVRSIQSVSGNWSITNEGNLIVRTIRAEDAIIENGVTVKDRATGNYSCIFVDNGTIKTSSGECQSEPSAGGLPIPNIVDPSLPDDGQVASTSTSTSTNPIDPLLESSPVASSTESLPPAEPTTAPAEAAPSETPVEAQT